MSNDNNNEYYFEVLINIFIGILIIMLIMLSGVAILKFASENIEELAPYEKLRAAALEYTGNETQTLNMMAIYEDKIVFSPLIFEPYDILTIEIKIENIKDWTFYMDTDEIRLTRNKGENYEK